MAISNATPTPEIIELPSSARREFCVFGAMTYVEAAKALARTIPEGDPHPWNAKLKASKPIPLRYNSQGGWVVAVNYEMPS